MNYEVLKEELGDLQREVESLKDQLKYLREILIENELIIPDNE